jgi:hypothetical protein
MSNAFYKYVNIFCRWPQQTKHSTVTLNGLKILFNLIILSNIEKKENPNVNTKVLIRFQLANEDYNYLRHCV